MNDLMSLNCESKNLPASLLSSSLSDKSQRDLKKLYQIRDQHEIWLNPLLTDCNEGRLTLADFQFLFSQYYLYSKNFTRLLAALMVNCESDLYRSKLSANLWEEGGGAEINQRHAEIFRRFLTESLQIDLPEDIVFKSFTHDFFNDYLNFCLQMPTLESAAALSFGTEGIVARLYIIIRNGLSKIGLSDEALHFFTLHIECDDQHAETLEELALSFSDQPDWFDKCKKSMVKILDLRNSFFTHIYQALRSTQLDNLINSASHRVEHPVIPEHILSNIRFSDNLLYADHNSIEKINFKVERLPFSSQVLDARLVNISIGNTNELHSHAHESIFLILEGEGQIIVGKNSYLVKTQDIIFVPRWVSHQTKNVGNSELKYFAITDYGFTKCFSGNTETVYRKKHARNSSDSLLKD